MIREQLTTDLSATACRSKEAVGRWQADTASRTNNLGFFALRKSPVNYTQSRGAVLLIAILVASVALAVGLGVYNRTYKELLFASYWKQTQVGFSAADAGLECAVYNDTHPAGGVFPSGSGGETSPFSFSCFGNNITGALEVGSPTGGVATSTFSAPVGNGCVNVTVVKSGSAGPYPLTFVATTTAGSLQGPGGVAISPDGTSVYVANFADSAIYQYDRATTTGNLNPPFTFATSGGASWVTVSPNGQSVYALSQGSQTIYQYDRATTTGALSNEVLSDATFPYGPGEMVISSDGLSAYVAGKSTSNSVVLQYDRNPATGALSNKKITNTTDHNLLAIAISPNDDFVYAAGDSGVWQYSRNKTAGPTFGDLSTLAPSPVTSWLNDSTAYGGGARGNIVVSPNGRSVYMTTGMSLVYQFTRDTTTGRLTPLLTPPTTPKNSFTWTGTGANPSAGAKGIVSSTDSSSVYVMNVGDSTNASSVTVSQFARDATGLLSLMNPEYLPTNLSGVIPFSGDVSGIAISRDGKSVYVTNFDDGLIYQFSTPAGSSPLSTLINARGYNTCDTTSPRRVERGLRVEY